MVVISGVGCHSMDLTAEHLNGSDKFVARPMKTDFGTVDTAESELLVNILNTDGCLVLRGHPVQCCMLDLFDCKVECVCVSRASTVLCFSLYCSLTTAIARKLR